jgi:iron complex outermembrane receptor protein
MSGVQWTTIENINIPGTGVLPFIPNYHENVIGMFGIAEYMAGSVIYDFGARYDFTNRNSTRRIRSPQNSNIERYDRNYHISTLTAGLSSDIIEQEVGLNIKYTGRVPDVSELYSQGLHQGTGTLEFGNPDIDQENAIILNTSSSGFILDNLSYDLHGYFRLFDNYIYLIATGENRLTIRGSYPVFEYRQTSAAIYGADLALQYDFTEEVHVYAGGSILRGDDLSEDQPLVNMAPNSTFVRADYHNEGFLWFDSSDFLLEYRYTFRQNHLLESQDILLPPDGYGLLGGTIKLKRTIGSDVLSFNLRFDNILNTVYRDYLNRLRYFADGTGFSASLIINYEF